MALIDILQTNEQRKKIGISEERVAAIKKPLRQYVAFWRWYPDLFVDFLLTGGRPVYTSETGDKFYKNDRGQEVRITFSLFFYQRVFLRVGMRFKYVYAVYPRAQQCALTSLIAGTSCLRKPAAKPI